MCVQHMKRGVVVFLLLITIVLIHTAYASAFGVSTPYLKDDTLLVNPGKVYEYVIKLQNNEEIGRYVNISYTSTDKIASLSKEEYYVPANTYDTEVKFNIIVPEGIVIGKTYALEYAARPRVGENGTVSMGVEIRRGITILVTDGTTNIAEYTENSVELTNENSPEIIHLIKIIGKIILIGIIILILIILGQRIWRISKSMSEKIRQGRRTKYTISEAVSLDEVKTLLKGINDEAFDMPEIRNLFKEKLSELTTSGISEKIHELTRKELIREIDKIKK
jgi:hypothetical protein